MKNIEIVVSPTGEIKLSTHGFGGVSCQAASRLLEEALGVRTSEQLTGEFYGQQPVREHQEQQQ